MKPSPVPEQPVPHKGPASGASTSHATSDTVRQAVTMITEQTNQTRAQTRSQTETISHPSPPGSQKDHAVRTTHPHKPSSERPGEAEFLAAYDMSKYEQPSVSVDVAIFTMRRGVFSTLLIKRADHPFKDYWAIPGGFLDLRKKENTTQAAWRELHEETGVEQFSGHLEQLQTYSNPGRDPRGPVISVAHVAFAPNLPDPQAGSDANDARWWAVDDLNLNDTSNPDAPELAFDHAEILRDAVERVRAKLEYTPLATAFIDNEFTLGELQAVYEAVWGVRLHRANFRRKVTTLPGFVRPVEGWVRPAGVSSKRPAALYTAGDATILHPALMRPSEKDTDAED